MAPVTVSRSAHLGEMSFLLSSMRPDGKVLTGGAIHTAKGTKVADVAWASTGRFQQIKDETECSTTPEVYIKVLSLSNTDSEIQEKRQLYFNRAAVEVWTCEADGAMHFYSAAGKLERSILFPSFPWQINI